MFHEWKKKKRELIAWANDNKLLTLIIGIVGATTLALAIKMFVSMFLYILLGVVAFILYKLYKKGYMR